MKCAFFSRLCAATVLLTGSIGWADTVIIVNHKSPIAHLTLSQAADIYLGRQRNWENGQTILPLDHPTGSVLRAQFYHDLTGQPIQQVNMYWSRQLFSGRATPPMAMPDAKSVIDTVKRNIHAMGYLSADPNDRDVRVVLTLPSRR